MGGCYVYTVYAFVQLPFGCAPACWVFTKLIKVMDAFWSGFGLKVLSYIDDGLGGAASNSEAEAEVFSDLVIDTLVKCGWIVNWAKSSFDTLVKIPLLLLPLGGQPLYHYR